MPTYLTDKCTEIRNWLAIGSEVYPDPVVISWIRMAEEQLSSMLRVKHMLQIDTSLISSDRVPLPRDWQEIRLVRLLPSKAVLRYNTPDGFFNPEFPEDPDSELPGQTRRYTIMGNFIYIGGSVPPGIQVEMNYYQDIPPLTDETDNWINFYHPTIYTLKILHVASLYSIDDERASIWNAEVANLASIMNTRHQIDKASGSVLMMTRRKTFG
jgi:hypothetical protein